MKILAALYALVMWSSLLIFASPVLADDHGDTFGTATVVSIGDATSGALEVAGDLDYFRFEVTETAKYAFYSRGNLDVEGYLYNEFSSLIASNRDGGELDNFRIVEILSPGTYYLEVSADFSGNDTGNYTIYLEGPDAAPTTDDHGSSIWSASNVNLGIRVTGALQVAGDMDFFRFEVPQTARYVFFSKDSVDVEGILIDFAYNVITSDRDGGELGNFRIVESLSPGTYFLGVSADFDNRTTGNYNFYIEGPGFSTPTDDHGESPWSATPLQSTCEVDGVIEPAGDRDFFSFQVVGSTAPVVIRSEQSIDVEGRLWDGAYDFITSDRDSGDLENFRITEDLAPGTYYVEVRDDFGGDGTGNYRVVVDTGMSGNCSLIFGDGFEN